MKHADRERVGAGTAESNDTTDTVEAEYQRVEESHTNSRVGDGCSQTGSNGH